MNASRQNEIFKFVFKFSELDDNLTDYEVSIDDRINVNNAVVTEATFDFRSSLSSTSALFTVQSSSNSISILDYDGHLNPLNTQSPYYGYMCQGLKVLAYVGDYAANVEDYIWSEYGTWYVAHWKGGMNLGGVTAVTIDCDDLLSEISAFDLSNTEYSGSTAAQAMTAVLTAVGLTSSDYTIDSNLDLTFQYTKLKLTAAQTLNDILTLARGYCTIKHNGKITFTSLGQVASYADTYHLDQEPGPLTQTMTTAVNYNRIIVKYPNGSNSQLAKIISNSAASISDGSNEIKLTLPKGVLSIEAVRIKLSGCADNDKLNDISYILSGEELTVTVSATLQSAKMGYIDVYITTPTSEATNEVSASLDGISSNASYAYEYNARFVTDKEEAQDIANSLAEAFKHMRILVSCGTSMLSPHINVGDTIEISGISDEYDGVYALVSFGIDMNESYNTSIKLLKYSEEA